MSGQCRVMIVEDHPIVAEGLAAALRGPCEVLGIANGGKQALFLATRHQPDIVLLDLSLGAESGFDLLPRILKSAPRTHVIVLTQYNIMSFQRTAREAGAKGFVAKSEAWLILLEAIQVVFSGGSWYSQPEEELAYVASCLVPSVFLTNRQIQVLQRLDLGMTYKEIGFAMGLSENTIDVYLRRIRKALGAHNAVDAVRLARHHGFLAPSDHTAFSVR